MNTERGGWHTPANDPQYVDIARYLRVESGWIGAQSIGPHRIVGIAQEGKNLIDLINAMNCTTDF